MDKMLAGTRVASTLEIACKLEDCELSLDPESSTRTAAKFLSRPATEAPKCSPGTGAVGGGVDTFSGGVTIGAGAISLDLLVRSLVLEDCEGRNFA